MRDDSRAAMAEAMCMMTSPARGSKEATCPVSEPRREIGTRNEIGRRSRTTSLDASFDALLEALDPKQARPNVQSFVEHAPRISCGAEVNSSQAQLENSHAAS